MVHSRHGHGRCIADLGLWMVGESSFILLRDGEIAFTAVQGCVCTTHTCHMAIYLRYSHFLLPVDAVFAFFHCLLSSVG